jgi:hypothetical protein
MMRRARKLIGMSQDDLFSFRPRPGPHLRSPACMAGDRSRSSPWRSFKAQIEAGGPVTHPDAMTSACDSLNRI